MYVHKSILYYYIRDAIIKLYKFIVIMDTMILKLTEYESIHLIKFDELFT